MAQNEDPRGTGSEKGGFCPFQGAAVVIAIALVVAVVVYVTFFTDLVTARG